MFRKLFSKDPEKVSSEGSDSIARHQPDPVEPAHETIEDKTVILRMAPATMVVSTQANPHVSPNVFEPATIAMGTPGDWDDRTIVLGAAPATVDGPPLPSGTILNARYEVIKSIGRGGFSYVYLCQHLRNGRLVAIKEAFAQDASRAGSNVIEGSAEHSQIARDAMLREVSAISRINHPGIVRFEDIFEQNNTLYFAMDYIEGEPLASLLERRGALSADTLAATSRSLLEAVAVLHANDVMHGDIKPGNIFVRPDKSVVLIDFGTAARLSDVEYPSPIVSAGYSPPERYEANAHLGTWSDVYSAAATIASAVTGKRPPAADQPETQTAYIDHLHSRSPGSWAQALTQALALEFSERPSGIGALSAAMGLRAESIVDAVSQISDGGSIFVSYAHKDSDIVERFVREMQRRGIGVWIDRQGIAPGSPAWGAEIVKGMRSAETCLMFSSSRSMSSEAVKDEIYLAKEFGKPIIVARLDEAPFHDDVLMFLTRSQHISAMRMAPSDFADAVRNALSGEPKAAA